VPENERALIAGCRELAAGNPGAALDHLRQATHLADGLCLAGVVALQRDAPDEAAKHLAAALERSGELGQGLGKYGVRPEIELTVTDEVSAHIGPDERGALLALTEAYQRQERWAEAIGCLERLGRLEPEDVVVKLSLAELLLEHKPEDEQASRQALDLAQGVENESPVHTALLLYKARALRGLGLPDAAEAVLSEALRRKKGRPDELLAGLHYERALLLEAAGQDKRASAELQKAYALAPDYEDVAARLGL
jgi:tetratricopeptide (TPR) repeat protein